VIDAKYWVPQHRERLFIVGFRDNLQFNFSRINTNYQPKLNSILDTVVDSKYTLKDGTWNCLQQHKIKHINNNSGFGYNLHTSNDVAKTLTARYAKDGAEILIQQSGNPRRLTPRECARLMGFDDNFKIVVSDTQAYKQFGNSVVPLVIQDIAKEIIKSLKNNQFAPCQLSIPFAS
jgi:DNA (cytosine-5)-methyltransferase 1